MTTQKTMLVTGGAGFIGSCFVRKLIAETDWRVVNLDALTYAGHLESLGPAANDERHLFVEGNITNGNLIASLLTKHSCSAVIHLAAESHVDRSISGPGDFVRTNVFGTFELLNASLGHWEKLKGTAKDAFRFLHVSTDEVFGSLGATNAFTEKTPYAPNSPYSASKASSDHFVRAYHKTYGLPTLTTNCSNNYGPYQFPEKLIPVVIKHAIQGKPIPLFGKGENVRDWLHVEDHCDALRLVLEKGQVGETYNLGGNAELTNLDVVKTICQLIDQWQPTLAPAPCENLIHFIEDRPGHDFRYAVDFSKIQSQLGWKPKVTFDEGIKRTVQWYLENQTWLQLPNTT